MGTYKLLALDMDGTLLDSQKRISPRTRTALEELAKRGVALAFSTGRNAKELLDYTSELPFIRYGVLASGSFVYDLTQSRTLATTPIPHDALRATISVARGEDALIFLSCPDGTRAQQVTIDRLGSYGMRAYQAMYDLICERIDDPLSWIASNPQRVMKMDVYHYDEAAYGRMSSKLEESGVPIQLFSSEPGCMEATAAGVDKGSGLRMLAAHLRVSMDEVVAVGDGGNDLAMLRAAGLPVAMGNASPEIREAARAIVDDNDHDGIVELIERFF